MELPDRVLRDEAVAPSGDKQARKGPNTTVCGNIVNSISGAVGILGPCQDDSMVTHVKERTPGIFANKGLEPTTICIDTDVGTRYRY